jgi:thiosulfate dehydrogenase (quinone) large subunit
MARADRHRTAAVASLAEPAPGLRASWERQPWVLRILRAFLGVTFLYAGLQKFLDPNFLHSGSPDFIGSQLQSFAQGSPIAPVLHLLNTLPVFTGVGVAVMETAVGVATLIGVAPATAAALGFVINLMLFLSATWRVHPYFLGSDSIYAAGWAAYLAGLLELRLAQPAVQHPRRRRMDPEDVTRRQFVRGAAVAAGTVALSAMAGAAAGSASTGAAGLSSGVSSSPSATRTRGSGSGGNGGSTDGTGSSGTGSSGTPVAKLASIPVGGAIGFQDAQGTPAILVRTGQQQVAAFSRVCTHAGCLVGYDQQAEMIVCPCHGAEFDPKQGARVVAGPAPTPLPSVHVSIGPTGEVVAGA